MNAFVSRHSSTHLMISTTIPDVAISIYVTSLASSAFFSLYLYRSGHYFMDFNERLLHPMLIFVLQCVRLLQ